jgi:hypothetical protein
MNSKFKANKLPMKMYYDFDNNGSFETIAIQKRAYYTTMGLDLQISLVAQLKDLILIKVLLVKL